MSSIGESTACSSLSEQVSILLNNNEISNHNDVPDMSLTNQCISVIAQNYSKRPIRLNMVQSDLSKKIVAKISTHADLSISVHFIHDENYWKKICIEKFGIAQCNIGEHGLTWKRLFIEKHLQDLLESYNNPEKDDLNNLFKTISSFCDYVFTLKFRQLSSHIMLDKICDLLPNLTKLEPQYGAINLNMDYNAEVFGMRLSDVDGLSKVIRETRALTTLILSGNQINDDMLRMLVKGIGENYSSTIMNLDLSHNKISTNGFRLLANKILGPDSVIRNLNVADNRIHAEGGRCLGRLLRSNKSLTHLNVNLNRFEDAGGRMLIDGIRDNTCITTLNMSSNSLGSQSAVALAAVFAESSIQSCLSYLDLSCNHFRENDIEILLTAFKRNTVVTYIDLRLNAFEISKEANLKFEKICQRNEMNTLSKINGLE